MNKNDSSSIKKYLIAISILIFFIIVLLIKQNFKLQETIKNKEVPSQNVKSDLFDKKQECIKYKDDIDLKMSQTEWDKYVLEEIFYSEQKNSCFFSVVAYKEKSAFLGESYVAYMVWDFLTDKLIFYRDSTLTNGVDIKNIYENAVSYLQGEDSLKYSEKEWMLD